MIGYWQRFACLHCDVEVVFWRPTLRMLRRKLDSLYAEHRASHDESGEFK